MLTLLTEVAVQNTSSPSSIAKLSNIMEGVDGSGAFNLTQETEAIQVEDNQRRQISESITLDLRVIEDSAQSAIIDAIQAGQDKALITAYTPNGFVVFPDPVLLMRNKQFDGVLASAVYATLKGTPGFRGNPRKRYFHAGRNLLGVYDVTTGRPDGLLNGFEVVSGLFNANVSPQGVMGIQSSGTFITRTKPIFFPFPGKTLTLSLGSLESSGANLGIQFLNANMGQEQLSLSGEGSYEVPTQTAFVSFYLSVSDQVTLSKPMISIDGSTNFEL